MNYAILNFNDNLYFKVEGIGLLPVIFKFQGLPELYFEKMVIQSNYTLSSIRDLEQDDVLTSEETEEIYAQKRACEMKIYKYMNEQNIPRKISVVQIGEEDRMVIVKELTTGVTLYVKPEIFLKHLVSELEAKNQIALEAEVNLEKLKMTFSKSFSK